MSEPPERPKGQKPTPAWYREVGLSIAADAGARRITYTKGRSQPFFKVSYTTDHWIQVELPAPTTHRGLYQFACGCGHIALRHQKELPQHRKDHRAKQWAISALARYGIDAPRMSDELPKKPSTQVVQEGRKAAARRYREVAADLAFEVGVEEIVYDRRSLSGKASYSTRRILVPQPTTRRRLYIFAHECAHIALAHEYKRPKHLEEYEAEQWAIAALRRHGVQVPRKELLHAKWNVARRIWQELRRGTKATDIDKEAMRFSGVKARQLTVPDLRARVIELRAALGT